MEGWTDGQTDIYTYRHKILTEQGGEKESKCSTEKIIFEYRETSDGRKRET